MSYAEGRGLSDEEPILRIEDLRTNFFSNRGTGKAVDGVSLELRRRETLGIVGESGCGKSTVALSIMRLVPKQSGRIVGGRIYFRGQDLLKASDREVRQLRGRKIALVLQDPLTSLNPVFTIGDQVGEPLRLHQGLRGSQLRARTVDFLRLLRIPEPEQRLDSYPHQFSGGMRQRVASAVALSCIPDILIADEPTSALDVTTQAAYLALLKDIQHKTDLAIIFITHDFGVVSKMCDRVAVMYAGRVVETSDTAQLFTRAAHPYTQALLRSVPDLRQNAERLLSIEGSPPSIYRKTEGCNFYERCSLRKQLGDPERCRVESPDLREVRPEQWAACHYADRLGDAAGTIGSSTA